MIAYSSMGQMGLIVLGIFASNDLGLDGAVLHSVNHGLVSAGLFLVAGMIETRTGTGVFSQLGGLAKGRPILATLVMVLGMFTLAVPGSSNFAGEFAILAGVFARGWGYAAVGAAAIVLAALYALRLISALLHERRGSAVREDTTDLVGNELVARRAARRDPRRALGVARRRSASGRSRRDAPAVVHRRPGRDRGSASRDRHAERRLARALADAGAARRLGASRCSAR